MGRSLVAVMLMTSAALAQPGAEPPPTAPSPPPEGAAPAANDPAWDAYDDAFTRAAAGDNAAAKTSLGSLSTMWPDHPASLRSRALLDDLAPKPEDPSAPSKVARGELVFWSTLGGVMLGANACVIVNCQGDREYAAVYMFSVGLPLAASVFATRNGIRNGEAQLYNSAQTWGAWNGLAINNDFASTRGEAAIALGAQAAGLGAGLVLWQTWRPTQGDVALTNTFWIWSSVLSVWGHLAADHDDGMFRRVVVIGDLGLIAGALVSTKVKMSRGRTLLIDVGGVLGILGGGLVAVGSDGDQAAGAALMVGTAAGLAAATLFTQEWDAPVTLSPAPVQGPQSTGMGMAASFAF